MNFDEIKNLTEIYVSSDHSSGFDYCELDWEQNVVWQEGELQDGFSSIEEFIKYKKYFYLSKEDAFSEINKVYYIFE